MKSVCIVGAGPAGLAAAKTLIQAVWRNSNGEAQRFSVTVLEKKSRVGGMWAVDAESTQQDPEDKCSGQMPTNLSHYTVAFSDLSWEKAREQGKVDGIDMGEVPMFPRAWQVGKYLQVYAKRIPEGTIRFNSEVIEAVRFNDTDGVERWRVRWETQDSRSNTNVPNGHSYRPKTQYESVFDHLIVASGFFQSPKALEIDAIGGCTAKIVHSSKFRSIQDAIPPKHTDGGSIVVIGGSISGPEAAAKIANAISNANNAPISERKYENYKIYHIITKPFYAVPMHLPVDVKNSTSDAFNPKPHFLPLDLIMYDAGRRPPGPIYAATGEVPPEKAQKAHQWLQNIVGSDQSDLWRNELLHKSHDEPPSVGLTDQYAEFVRSGDIIPVRGRAISLEASPSHPEKNVLRLDGRRRSEAQAIPLSNVPPEPVISIHDVIGVVYATGFDPTAAISWLPSSVLETLEYDSSSPRLPLILQANSIFHPGLPSLAFVGMYEGPFWGIMELQARLIARRWSTDALETYTPTPENETAKTASLTPARNLRAAMKARSSSVPQFWMGDYIGLIDSLARELHIPRLDIPSPTPPAEFKHPSLSPLIPARYPLPSPQPQSTVTLASLAHTLAHPSIFLPRAIFRALQGRWHMSRQIASKRPEYPLRGFTGVGTFAPRIPTAEGYTGEYVYKEQGTAWTDSGLEFEASAGYVYRLGGETVLSDDNDNAESQSAVPGLSVWFVKRDSTVHAEVDYMYNSLQFIDNEDIKAGETGWVAVSDHPCRADNYKSRCEFRFRGVALETFCIKYDVKGPQKDYVSETWFRRLRAGEVVG